MAEVLIVIHLLIVLVLVGLVLLQKSEGGGLGIGGGSGFMTARGSANVLTRTTAILAGLFFLTSIILSVLGSQSRQPRSILDSAPRPAGQTAPSGQGGGILDQLNQLRPQQPAAPAPQPDQGPQAPLSR
ncbi:preprotein translocase subunit SecG [Candidatus Raskinella chloraquaticus]|uniref:Protein-export membrane protein SecG n=1 Tax=Candidatus Raskinella chloraquaticus TaxID=1951219 RepID=A0A1W9HZP9_9HYPH|nr:MAG: preprotein translocase subunit SecG [Proteobacteria bacterium SG_bin8]